jgi:hypothetical protein
MTRVLLPTLFGLGKISPKVSRSFVRRVGRVRSQIIAGKIKVPASLS